MFIWKMSSLSMNLNSYLRIITEPSEILFFTSHTFQDSITKICFKQNYENNAYVQKKQQLKLL